MVLRHAPQEEILGVIPIGRAEFPKRIANRVQTRYGHVDRAEAAVRRPVRRAELLRPQARQRLHLVAPGNESELGGIRRADVWQARGEGIDRLVPHDLDEFAAAARAAGFALE